MSDQSQDREPPSQHSPEPWAEVRDAWTENWNDLHLNHPQRLYHYTGPAGLEGMIETQVFHASDALYLNDSTELDYAESVLWDVLDEATDGSTSPAVTVFGERAKNSLFSTARGALTVYIVCFCEEPDLLSQWRGYGSEGGGYALGFDAAHGGCGHYGQRTSSSDE